MSYHDYTRLDNTYEVSNQIPKTLPVRPARPLYEPRKPGVTQPQSVTTVQPSSSSDSLDRQSVRFVPNFEVVTSSSAPPIPPLPQTPLPPIQFHSMCKYQLGQD